MKNNYQGLESEEMGKGRWAVFRSIVEESSSKEVTPSTELDVVREEPGSENRQCKGPEVGCCTCLLAGRLMAMNVRWLRDPKPGSRGSRAMCIFFFPLSIRSWAPEAT